MRLGKKKLNVGLRMEQEERKPGCEQIRTINFGAAQGD